MHSLILSKSLAQFHARSGPWRISQMLSAARPVLAASALKRSLSKSSSSPMKVAIPPAAS